MKQYAFAKWMPLISPHGRLLQGKDGVWFNWSCSGFTIAFTGSKLRAYLIPIGEPSPVSPPQHPVIEYPYAGVSEDGETLTRRFICEKEGWYTLFEGEDGQHSLRLIKITENMRGKLLLASLETDGELLPAPAENKPLIEFVGDSITCGYGNEAPGRDEPFRPEEENGWMSFGPQAARKLGMEFSCLSVSGIAVSDSKNGKFTFPCPQMNALYSYTDRLMEEKSGGPFTDWDFAAHPATIVLINLGTNDVNPVRFADSRSVGDEEEAWFTEQYQAFLKQVRSLNGPECQIVCTLGPLDYYLYDQIEKAVHRYQQETGDQRITAFKLTGVNLMTEGFGADGHPSMKTHTRLGKELAERLQKLLF